MATNSYNGRRGAVPTVTRRDLSSVDDDVLQQYAMRDGVDHSLHRRAIIQQLFNGRSYIPALKESNLTSSPRESIEVDIGHHGSSEAQAAAGGEAHVHEPDDRADASTSQSLKRSRPEAEDVQSDGKRFKASPISYPTAEKGKWKARDSVSPSPPPVSQAHASESSPRMASDNTSPPSHRHILQVRLIDYDGDADSEQTPEGKPVRAQRPLPRRKAPTSPERLSSASPPPVKEKKKKRTQTYDERIRSLLVKMREDDRASGDESEVSEVDTDPVMELRNEGWTHRRDLDRECAEWWKERKIAKLRRREEKRRREEVRVAKKEWKVEVDAAAAAAAEDTQEDDEDADAHPPRMPVYHPVEDWEVELVVLTDKARRIDRVTRREERMWARHNALVAEGQGYEIPDDPLVLSEDCSGPDTDESDPEWEKADWQFASYRRRHSYAPRLRAGLNRRSLFWDLY